MFTRTLFSFSILHRPHKKNFLGYFFVLFIIEGFLFIKNYHFSALFSQTHFEMKKSESSKNSFLWSFYTAFIFLIHFNVHEAAKESEKENWKPWIWIKQKSQKIYNHKIVEWLAAANMTKERNQVWEDCSCF